MVEGRKLMHATLTFKCTPTESLNKDIQKNRIELRGG